MKQHVTLAGLSLALIASLSLRAAPAMPPAKIILDVDLAEDVDDAGAVAVLHDLKRSSDAPDAAVLCRQLLAGQPDRSVTIVTVGFLTNLRNLLDSQPDQARLQ